MIDADGNVHEPDPSKRYEKYYHLDGVTPQMLAAFRAIAIAIIDTLHLPTGSKMIDMGCSGGGLVREMCSLGMDAIGVDGSAPALDVTPGKVLQHDLRVKENVPWELGAYELVTSCDVLEHIEESGFKIALENIVGAAKPDGWIVFGAAPPGQGGLGHVHLRAWEFWRDELSAIGAAHEPNLSSSLTEALKSKPAVIEAWWWIHNAKVYKKVG